MCWQFSPEELDLFASLRKVFDPHGLFNPGKAIPTLHRCAEFGGMHVMRDAIPFPELPRF
jgi:glycolate oxidase